MKNSAIFICEGETEAAIINALQLHGKVVKCNLWERDIKKLIKKINRPVYVIYDTDIASQKKLPCFNKNVQTLKTHTKLMGFLQQTENLEDELCRACQKISSTKQLQKHFNAAGDEELKSQLLKASNLLQKLHEIGLDETKLWKQETITLLQPLKLQRKHYPNLPKRHPLK